MKFRDGVFPFSPHHRRALFWSAAALLLLAGGYGLVRPLNLGALVRHNPVPTALMTLRAQQARAHGRSYRCDQHWVSLHRIARPLRQAVIAAEDDGFYRHGGLAWDEIWVCLKYDWQHQNFSRGGSTLTQQVAKNLFLSPRKSLARKFREAILAVRLEHALSKDRILEIYLNVAEWGRGIFGAEAAARHYFHKSARELNVEEAVALVAVLPSPLRHSPLREDRFLSWRKAWIRRRLLSLGYLTPADFSVTPPAPADLKPLVETEAARDPSPAQVAAAQSPAAPQESRPPLAGGPVE